MIYCACFVGFLQNPPRYRVRCMWGLRPGPYHELELDEVPSPSPYPSNNAAQRKANLLAMRWEKRLYTDPRLRERLTMESLL